VLFRSDCVLNGVKNLHLSVYGEPFMDTHLFERIKYLRDAGITYGFHTNGSLMDSSKAQRLFEMGGMQSITFSVCGFDKEAYEETMVGLTRDVTYKNILGFLDLKMQHGGHYPSVAISSVKTNRNKADIQKFVSFWKKQKGVNQIIIADLWDRTGGSELDKIGSLGPMHSNINWCEPCIQVFGQLYVYFDGRVSPCCDNADLRGLIVGDLNKQTLTEVVNGPALSKLRALHLSDRRKDHPVCGKCGHQRSWAWLIS
jgi:MoaA/NifB/PqqE/SkfB family radical SAM enzyme